jgi:hypothetical protein
MIVVKQAACAAVAAVPEGDGGLVEQDVHAVAVEQQHTLGSAIYTTSSSSSGIAKLSVACYFSSSQLQSQLDCTKAMPSTPNLRTAAVFLPDVCHLARQT